MAKKEFPVTVLASITTGILMHEGGFGDVHEAIEWIVGHPVWTHEIPSQKAACERLLLDQHPTLPTKVDGQWQAFAAGLVARFGATLPVRRGSNVRERGPVETAREIMGGRNG